MARLSLRLAVAIALVLVLAATALAQQRPSATTSLTRAIPTANATSPAQVEGKLRQDEKCETNEQCESGNCKETCQPREQPSAQMTPSVVTLLALFGVILVAVVVGSFLYNLAKRTETEYKTSLARRFSVDIAMEDLGGSGAAYGPDNGMLPPRPEAASPRRTRRDRLRQQRQRQRGNVPAPEDPDAQIEPPPAYAGAPPAYSAV